MVFFFFTTDNQHVLFSRKQAERWTSLTTEHLSPFFQFNWHKLSPRQFGGFSTHNWCLASSSCNSVSGLFLDAELDWVKWQQFFKALLRSCGFIHLVAWRFLMQCRLEGHTHSTGVSLNLFTVDGEIPKFLCKEMFFLNWLTTLSSSLLLERWWFTTHLVIRLQRLSLWWMLVLYWITTPLPVNLLILESTRMVLLEYCIDFLVR